MRAVQDVAAGARSDAGEADNVDNDEVIRSYYAAVEKLGPLVRVRVSDMRFSTKFATRSRDVVDNFITRLPVSGGRKRSAEAIRRRAREKYLKKQNTTNTN
ncbi:hypothetical protein NFJ02_12g12230 [Pycnococcus provasolii]